MTRYCPDYMVLVIYLNIQLCARREASVGMAPLPPKPHRPLPTLQSPLTHKIPFTYSPFPTRNLFHLPPTDRLTQPSPNLTKPHQPTTRNLLLLPPNLRPLTHLLTLTPNPQPLSPPTTYLQPATRSPTNSPHPTSNLFLPTSRPPQKPTGNPTHSQPCNTVIGTENECRRVNPSEKDIRWSSDRGSGGNF
ncbi:uncharacterized protein LOC135225250 [Macrobrachium nipponense]|uniref:uncharacterized protein LOC135225250 n=1 Tax=Macrobrachium nipponense TaxID=159736 RepID=UPI0030C8CCD4